MSFQISKLFEFSASHQLTGLPDDHQCARMHGHNYQVRVELTSEELDNVGFVVDYGELAPVKSWIDDNLDHRHLNDVPALDGENPTAEVLARTLYGITVAVLALDLVRMQLAVEVSETPKTWARFEP
jgi:6-pyruvoyltetrahydropterin/6-carboxytetrahydropterin synthase